MILGIVMSLVAGLLFQAALWITTDFSGFELRSYGDWQWWLLTGAFIVGRLIPRGSL